MQTFVALWRGFCCIKGFVNSKKQNKMALYSSNCFNYKQDKGENRKNPDQLRSVFQKAGYCDLKALFDANK